MERWWKTSNINSLTIMISHLMEYQSFISQIHGTLQNMEAYIMSGNVYSRTIMFEFYSFTKILISKIS